MKYVLLIREVDRRVYEALRKGEKSVETRAMSDEYGEIKVGDWLVFNCGKDSLEKEVGEVKHFKSLRELLDNYGFEEIMPFVESEEEALKVWESFPGYKERIAKGGMLAFELKA